MGVLHFSPGHVLSENPPFLSWLQRERSPTFLFCWEAPGPVHEGSPPQRSLHSCSWESGSLSFLCGGALPTGGAGRQGRMHPPPKTTAWLFRKERTTTRRLGGGRGEQGWGSLHALYFGGTSVNPDLGEDFKLSRLAWSPHPLQRSFPDISGNGGRERLWDPQKASESARASLSTEVGGGPSPFSKHRRLLSQEGQQGSSPAVPRAA